MQTDSDPDFEKVWSLFISIRDLVNNLVNKRDQQLAMKLRVVPRLTYFSLGEKLEMHEAHLRRREMDPKLEGLAKQLGAVEDLRKIQTLLINFLDEWQKEFGTHGPVNTNNETQETEKTPDPKISQVSDPFDLSVHARPSGVGSWLFRNVF